MIEETSLDVPELGRAEERLRKCEPGFGAGVARSNDGLNDRLGCLVDLVRVLRLWFRLGACNRLGGESDLRLSVGRGVQLGLGRLEIRPGTPWLVRASSAFGKRPSTRR